MKRLVTALVATLALLALAVPVRAADITERRIDARTLDLEWYSPAVGQRVQARLLLPRGWSRTAKRTWPVLYAYQGGRDDYTSWTRETDIARLAATRDVLVVMPSGGENGSYTNWWNDGAGGIPRWEDHHVRELPALMKRYRAGDRRAVLGVSSGGQGAMAYAARHPGMFRYAASFSGSTHLTMHGMQIFLTAVNLLGSGADAFRIFGVPGRDDANWRAHDPHVLAERLRGTGLYVSSGTTGMNGPFTPPGAQWRLTQLSEILIGQMNHSFVNRLRELRIPVTAHIYGDGWHAWPEWTQELHTAWPLIMTALGAGRTTP
ncbi:alpha/beta hydrolase [Actinomadura flavalba]|uniref:alpha/beta hydrolase n=1 Tax=Actinomadura flavalba TaxID=1120938 RepID=UPI000381823F|nr:alpha/beta hydrolase family protein [Actinomadura flavalba]